MIAFIEIVDAGCVQGECLVHTDVESNAGGIAEISEGARRRPVRALRREIVKALI